MREATAEPANFLTRRRALQLSLASGLSRLVPAAEARPLPNLLFVFADQMRHMSMGCAGCPDVKTPNLDRFAAERGRMFTNAVSNLPICAPYRASLLTGRFPLSSTVITNNVQLPPEMPSMGKILRQAGYCTGYIGKWHLKGEPAQDGFVPSGPMRHGFDYWAVHNCSHRYEKAVYYRDEPKSIPIQGWEPDGQTDLAIEFMRRNVNKPFALVVSWGPPHTPFEAPKDFRALYNPDRLTLRPNAAVSRRALAAIDDLRYRMKAADPQDLLKEITLRYYAAISNLDYNFGRLLRSLEELGIESDTIVVFTSDHGEMLGSQGHFHKGQPWDESVRVPFLISYPGIIKEGRRSDLLLGTPDILPTLLGLMGLTVPKGIEGRDLSAALRGESVKEPDSALLLFVCAAVTWGRRWNDITGVAKYGFTPGFIRPYRGVRTRTHTYVRDREGPWMLYDNEKDPYQQNNLLETRGKRTIPAECEKELAAWLERTGDYFGSNADYEKLVDAKTGIVTSPAKLKV